MARTTATTRATAATRTAISRRQTLRAGGSVFKNTVTSGNVLTGTYSAGNALDILAGNTPSIAFTLRAGPQANNVMIATRWVAGGWGFGFSSTGDAWIVYVGNQTVAAAKAILLDRQHHRYVYTFDGIFLRVYRDGALVATSGNGTGLLNWTSQPGTFNLLSGSNQNLAGTVDDIALYQNYVWSAADVANDWYDGTLPTVVPSARWTFDERFGTTVADASGNGFAATITNGSFVDEVPPWSLPGTAAKRYPDGFNPYAYLNGGAAYFSDLGATVAAGLISQLNDQSGNGWNMLQATGANKPAYTAGGINGKPFLTYGASGAHWMATAGAFVVSDNAPGLTIYVVGSIAADFIGGDFVARTNGAGGATYLWSIGQVGGSTGNFNSSVRNAANTQVNNFGNTNIAPGMATTAIWSMRYDGTHNRSYTNGRPKYQDNQGQVTGNLATAAASQPLVLGFPAAGTGGTTTLYAAIVAIGAHDDDTMRWYHRYLSDYYQIPLLA